MPTAKLAILLTGGSGDIDWPFPWSCPGRGQVLLPRGLPALFAQSRTESLRP